MDRAHRSTAELDCLQVFIFEISALSLYLDPELKTL
jgi:hypothetical protein